jgi:predicted outer membrane repeat protein
MTGIAAFGGIVTLGLGSSQAVLAQSASSTQYVPCSAFALARAISAARSGDTLLLAFGCTYELHAALPDITTELTLMGEGSTLERSYAPDTPSFPILTVEGRPAVDLTLQRGSAPPTPSSSILKADGESAGDLTLTNVNFRDGGGSSDYEGGAIYNDGGDVTIHGGAFYNNKTDEYGGAIYNSGTLTVSDASFAGNSSVYGGAIETEDNATISRTTFSRNAADALFGDPTNAYGGAIYNDGHTLVTGDTFFGNTSAGFGGGIYNTDSLAIDHTLIAHNDATVGGGGIYNDDSTVTLTDTGVLGNVPDNCEPVGTIAGCTG